MGASLANVQEVFSSQFIKSVSTFSNYQERHLARMMRRTPSLMLTLAILFMVAAFTEVTGKRVRYGCVKGRCWASCWSGWGWCWLKKNRGTCKKKNDCHPYWRCDSKNAF